MTHTIGLGLLLPSCQPPLHAGKTSCRESKYPTQYCRLDPRKSHVTPMGKIRAVLLDMSSFRSQIAFRIAYTVDIGVEAPAGSATYAKPACSSRNRSRRSDARAGHSIPYLVETYMVCRSGDSTSKAGPARSIVSRWTYPAEWIRFVHIVRHRTSKRSGAHLQCPRRTPTTYGPLECETFECPNPYTTPVHRPFSTQPRPPPGQPPHTQPCQST